jgi:hypothetical protein
LNLLFVAFGFILVIAAFWLSSLMIVGIVAGIFMLIIIYRKPELGLLAITFITAGIINLEQIPFLTMGSISFHFSDIILLFLLAIIMIKKSALPGFKIIRTTLDLPMIWFLSAIFLSAFIAIEVYGVDRHWVFRRMRPLTYYLAFFCVVNLIRTKKQVNVLISGLFTIAILGSLATIALVAYPSMPLGMGTSGDLVTAGREFSGVTRIYLPSITLTSFIFIVSMSSLIMRSKRVPPILEFASSAVMGVGIFLSYTRNLWISMISMLALLGLLLSWPERFRILKWVAVGVFGVVLLVSYWERDGMKYLEAAQDRLFRGTEAKTLAEDSSVEWRIMETKYAVESIFKHPIVGIGLGNFYRPAIFENESAAIPDRPNFGMRWYVHNAYLWVLVDMGLIGIIPFAWVHSNFLLRGFRRWKQIEDIGLRSVVLGLTLAYLGLMISNFVAPSFVSDWSLVIFPVVIGINEVAFSLNQQELSAKNGKKRYV